MKNAFIIHGAYGNPNENWIPWLKLELEKLNYKVTASQFPTPDNQSLASWTKVFKPYTEQLNNETILIGHSIGATFILNILEGTNKIIKATYLVSGFVSSLNNVEFDELNKTFYEKSFDWLYIKQRCKNFLIFHSDNDPYVPTEKANEIARCLNVKVVMVKDGGHFNEKFGYKTFNLLLEAVKKNEGV